jgi:hypothetical protein
MMIESMGRGFAPIAAVLSFIAVGKQCARSSIKATQHSHN